MDDRLWTPPGSRVLPTERKKDGGSYFDDELETRESRDAKLKKMYDEMVRHLQQRPDHVVYVGSTKDREQMRQVFNHMFRVGVLPHHPTIKIEYGIPEGQIRIDEDRG